MDYRTSYKVMVYCYIIAFIIALFGYCFSGGMILAILAIIILATGLIQSIFFLKCPKCNEYINVRGGRPKYCPNCGEQLDWE